MKSLLFTTVFIQILLSVAADQLVLVQAVWRHGDRTPAVFLPNDPNVNYSWPQGLGELTFLGMKQHLALGKKLRNYYVDQLGAIPGKYNSQQVYIRSTDVNRTLISAMSNMLGMFPGGAGEFPDDPDWPKDQNGFGWIPIPIHTIDSATDRVLIPDLPCKRQEEFQNAMSQSPEYQQLSTQMAEFIEFVGNETEIPSMQLGYMPAILDPLSVEEINNLTLPSWATIPWKDSGKTVYDIIRELAYTVEYWSNGLRLAPMNGIDFSTEIPKIRGGPLLWSFINNMKQKLYCMNDANDLEKCLFFNDLKYYAYSGHDVTIAGLFSALGFNQTNWNQDGYPLVSSCVTVELWTKDDGSDYVKFMYWPLDENMTEITSSISDCGDPCTLEALANRSEIYRPDPDIDTLCDTSFSQPSSASRLSIISTVISLIFVFHLY